MVKRRENIESEVAFPPYNTAVYRTRLAVHGAFDCVGFAALKAGNEVVDTAPLMGVGAMDASVVRVVNVEDTTATVVEKEEDATATVIEVEEDGGTPPFSKISFCAPSAHPHFWL